MYLISSILVSMRTVGNNTAFPCEFNIISCLDGIAHTWEKLRKRPYMRSKSLNQEFFKHAQACEAVTKHEREAKETVVEDSAQAGSSMKFIDLGERLMVLPRGIQVEDSTAERQPTMDLRRPRTWDSDVVIQINVQDSNENCSGSNKEDHIDDSGYAISRSMNLDVNDLKDSDESPVKPLGKLRSSLMNGCIQTMSESKQMLLVPDNHVKDQNFDFDGYHDCEVNAQTSEDIAEVKEPVQIMEEENAANKCKSDQCLTETDLSVGDRILSSLTLSCSGTDSDSSRDSVYNTPEESDSHLRRLNSGAVQQELVSTDYESPKSDGARRIPIDSQHHSKIRSTLWERRRHQKRRLHKVAERVTHPDTDNDTSPISRDWLSTDFHRQVGRLHDFAPHSDENSSLDRQRKLSGSYNGKFSDNHVHGACIKHPRRKYHQSFRDVMKAQDRRSYWNEDNLNGRSLRLDDRDAINRDWGSCGKGLSPEGTIPLTCREPRRLVSKYNNLKEMNIQRGRNCGKIRCGKKTNVDACFLNHKDLDVGDFSMLPLSGRSFPPTSQRRDSLDGKYEGDIPFVGRGNLYGRRIQFGHCSPTNLENSWSMDLEDGHWEMDRQHLSSFLHRKFSMANEGRWKNRVPPGSTSFDSRLTERYRGHRREEHGDKCRDSHWVNSYNDVSNAEADVINSDERFHQKRKYSSQSGVLSRMRGESIWGQQDDDFYARRSSCSYEKSSTHRRIHAKLKSADGNCMVVDDVQLKWNSYKMFKGERSVGFVNRNHNMMSRGEQGWTARSCSHPVDLIFGAVKSSRRCSVAESSMSNGISGRMDMKFAKVKDFKETPVGRATKRGNAKIKGSQIDERWLDKFPVSKQDGYLDIEEGQIVPEEPTIGNRLEEKQAPETVSLMRSMKNAFHSGNMTNKRYDDQQILESLAKMEKRRERFKDPIAFKREPDKPMKPIDLIADAIKSKQERPARKRRWADS
ncbi:uncharacterized protein LOC8258813 isoform X2 [Ricinus communis]|uniref:uncharacterized protein LOC8258813 isoform X2 n=1 Tax=Ricinus communis TaxID=3988 RepID=UPI0007721AB0|nr:uncharacterized protein LOC8258813 isoform X2 [Ricinus communis]|eukprot:XP_015574772.1 uncharacterized protein LOC8258813 isoform X2 [Ricinus communis]